MRSGVAPDGPPRVSVGMPAYNSEQWIDAAIESVLAQTFDDIELIISDNGSTDRTPAICQEYADRDARVRLIRQNGNRGAAFNYNAVLSEARAPYFKWASSNDLCDPKFVESCVQCLDSDPDVVLAYPASVHFDEDPSRGEPYDDELGLDVADTCVRFIRFVDRVGKNNLMNGVARIEALREGPPHKCFIGSDYIVMAALTLRGRFRRLPEPLYYRRMNEAAATQQRSRREIVEHFDPSGARRMLFQYWRRRLEFFGTISAARIPLRDKARLYIYLARSTLGARDRLWDDTRSSLRLLAAGTLLGRH